MALEMLCDGERYATVKSEILEVGATIDKPGASAKAAKTILGYL